MNRLPVIVLAGAGLLLGAYQHRSLAQDPLAQDRFDPDRFDPERFDPEPLAQEPLTLEDWPGSRKQAELLAAEPKDLQWSGTIELRLVDGIEQLERLQLTALGIECRTRTCGIAFDFVVADPNDYELQQSSRVSAYVRGALREAFRRLALDGIGYESAIESRVDGLLRGHFEFTLIDPSRA